MAFKNQMRIRLAFQILLEVRGEAHQRLLLAGHDPAVGLELGRLRSREVDTVQCEPRFQLPDLRRNLRRRWRRSLDRDLGRGRSVEPALIAASGFYGDCSR